MNQTTEKPDVRRIYQGSDRERLKLRRRVLIFSLLCLLTVGGGIGTSLGWMGSQPYFVYYAVITVVEALLTTVLVILSAVLASHNSNLRERVYLWTVASIPGLCLALILCNALTVIAALIYMYRYGVQIDIILSLISMLLNLVCMEFAHLCRKTVTHSIWVRVLAPDAQD